MPKKNPDIAPSPPSSPPSLDRFALLHFCQATCDICRATFADAIITWDGSWFAMFCLVIRVKVHIFLQKSSFSNVFSMTNFSRTDTYLFLRSLNLQFTFEIIGRVKDLKLRVMVLEERVEDFNLMGFLKGQNAEFSGKFKGSPPVSHLGVTLLGQTECTRSLINPGHPVFGLILAVIF